jgi:ATP/maltotriose-dependent transcriptional regulator MalT
MGPCQAGPSGTGRAHVVVDRGEGLAAELARAARHLEQMIPQVPWRIILAEAERWAVRAEKVLQQYPDAGVLVGRVGRLRQTLEQRRLADPLTPAERRVLELLPTQLTAPQIAARLFVSTNTAKTHMRHLYAKLGVTTRTDAVDRARRLRLLTPADQD